MHVFFRDNAFTSKIVKTIQSAEKVCLTEICQAAGIYEMSGKMCARAYESP